MTETTQETKTRYTFGHGHSAATSKSSRPETPHEVLLVTETADGEILSTDIVLTVPSMDKAKAIAMILNAPENY